MFLTDNLSAGRPPDNAAADDQDVRGQDLSAYKISSADNIVRELTPSVKQFRLSACTKQDLSADKISSADKYLVRGQLCPRIHVVREPIQTTCTKHSYGMKKFYNHLVREQDADRVCSQTMYH